MPRSISLCLNCLSAGARPVEVGPQKGVQIDPYREAVDLCDACRNALLGGHFDVLARRFQRSRVVGASR